MDNGFFKVSRLVLEKKKKYILINIRELRVMVRCLCENFKEDEG